MRLIYLILIMWLSAFPALACIPTVTVDGSAILVNRGGGLAEFRYDALRNGADSLRAEQLRVALQALMDDRRLREGIEGIDPNRSVNPGLPTIYWSDADGNPVESILDATHVTSRCVLVTEVFWDGFDFVVSWQRIR